MVGASFYKLGAFFARRLPQKLSESITLWIVGFQYLFRFRSRRIVRDNLRIVVGDRADNQEIHGLARRVFSNFGRSIYYFLRLPFMSDRELRARCDYSGLDEAIREAGDDGAFIFVGPHLGAWEIGAACLARLGIRLLTVALPHPSASVTRFFDERREMVGVECSSLPESTHALRGALREGKSVALLIDRAYGGRTGSFRWFDKDVELPLGHVAIAVRYGVPILTTVCTFDGDGGFKFVFGGPHYPRSDLGSGEAMVDLQEKCIADMTSFIREFPDQWFHFHPLGARPSDHNT
jgi:KDO2-lipid IV(A) lauroyltransferase